MKIVRSVLGNIDTENLGITLSHEHIAAYSNYLYSMGGEAYLDIDDLEETAVKHLKEIKAKYGVSTFIDGTPVNLGRDADLLKRVSKKSGVNIICSTGFYHTEESAIMPLDNEDLFRIIHDDIINTGAGIIKYAVENEHLSEYDKKMLSVLCLAQYEFCIPFYIHTNSKVQNGIEVLDYISSLGSDPKRIIIGHCSDSDSSEYIKHLAEKGCFIGMDRIFSFANEEFLRKKALLLAELSVAGYENQILLSHDALVFSGFSDMPFVNQSQPFSVIFEKFIPILYKRGFTKKDIDNFLLNNPKRMFLGAFYG